nr:MAG TPA: hypothetical protein [Microviridae sp.]
MPTGGLPFGIAQKEAKRLVFFIVLEPNGLSFHGWVDASFYGCSHSEFLLVYACEPMSVC